MVFMMPPGVAPDPERSRRRRARTLLRNPDWRDAARDAVGRDTECDSSPSQHPQRVRFIEVTKPELEPWLGRTLGRPRRGARRSSVRRVRRLDPRERPPARAPRVGVGNSNVDDVAELLVDPDTVVASSDAGAHVQMMCAAGDTTLLLARHVRDRGDLTVEQAVHELSGKHADVFGLPRPGRIEPGKVADLTVFALDELHWDARRVRRRPAGRRPPPSAPAGRLPLHTRRGRGHPGGRRAHRRPSRGRVPLRHRLTLKDSSGWPRD